MINKNRFQPLKLKVVLGKTASNHRAQITLPVLYSVVHLESQRTCEVKQGPTFGVFLLVFHLK